MIVVEVLSSFTIVEGSLVAILPFEMLTTLGVVGRNVMGGLGMSCHTRMRI